MVELGFSREPKNKKGGKLATCSQLQIAVGILLYITGGEGTRPPIPDVTKVLQR